MSFEDDPRETLQRSVERLLHNIVYQRHPVTHFTEPRWSPALDLMVSERSARVLVELAGVPRQNVRVRLQGRVLEISGRREGPHKVGGAHYHLAEIQFSDFRRAIELPWNADPDHIEATHRDGLLEIRLVPAHAENPANIPVEHHGST